MTQAELLADPFGRLLVRNMDYLTNSFARQHLSASVDPSNAEETGAPTLKGSRYRVSQVLSELAKGRSIVELAKTEKLSKRKLEKLLSGLAVMLQRPEPYQRLIGGRS